MNRIIFSSLALMLCASAANAQETYESATIADKDLNGTARYVGMGGAMEALGADISTIGSNPAGVGMFRKSQVAGTAGIQSIEGSSVPGVSKTKASFDQLGFVLSMKSGSASYFNVGFNYHKSRDFNRILYAANSLSGASQNKLSYLKGALGVYDIDTDDRGYNIGWKQGSDYTSNAFTQVDYLYYNNFLQDADGNFYYDNATGFCHQRAESGYISDFDFNLSGNISNRVYLGATIGVQDVRYKSESQYTETLQNSGSVALADRRRITGTGINVKFGAIFRPVETSPFRIGAYIHTPTWYKLTTENTTALRTDLTGGSLSIGETYDFRLNTPWVFGASLGHTVDNILAIGATYEYSKYSALDNRYLDGGYYDSYNNYHDSSSSDRSMKENTEMSLKGVHTLKVGAELKMSPAFAIRVGYNYVSPKYNAQDGYKDGSINSYGSYYASQTDYTNWKATNRITCGAGWNTGGFSVDIAYQYSQTDGEYFPFMSYSGDSDASYDNVCDMTKVSDKRHRVLLTLGYRF